MARWRDGVRDQNIERILERTAPERERLRHHPMYDRIVDLESARCFMHTHVFAVWDFMSLLKRLQRTLTGVRVPWVPVGDATVRRFVNELVLEEESDEHPSGGYSSHFELYLDAMHQAGCDTAAITALVAAVEHGDDVLATLDALSVSGPVRDFVAGNIDTALHGRPHEVAAAFTFGREELIPRMFSQLLRSVESSPQRLDLFREYLVRHIALDADVHGPMAFRMLTLICGDEEDRWQEAEAAAASALGNRVALWDGVLASLPAVVA